MRMHFLSIPVFDSSAAEAELNRFFASHRVVAIDRQFVADGARSAWAVCVSYIEGAAAAAPERAADPVKKKPVDYREVLSPEDFQVFARLRVLRKELSERDGVPAYAVFTNEQLAAMVKERIQSAADLARLENIGKARVDKYGAPFLSVLREVPPVQREEDAE